MVISIRNKECVCGREDVRFSENPLSEVRLSFMSSTKPDMGLRPDPHIIPVMCQPSLCECSGLQSSD